MEEDKDKNGNFNQEITIEEKKLKTKIYNYFYFMLREKKETNSLEISILIIFETIQLVSYGIADPHISCWKVGVDSMKTISDIVGIFRISMLMKYVKFSIYLIIFFFLIVFIFGLCIFLIMQFLFGKPESKIFTGCLTATRVLFYPLTIFFFTPIIELVLLPLKCKDNKVDIIVDGITCWNKIHYLYVILGIVASLLFFLCLSLLNTLYFWPFNYQESSIKINSFSDTVLLLSKYVFTLRFLLIDNEYVSIVILLLLSLFLLIEEYSEPSFNNKEIEIMVNIRNSLAFWTYFILLIAKICESTKINGIIYLLLFGMPITVVCIVLLVQKRDNQFKYNTAIFNNLHEYLQQTRFIVKLIDSFIEGSKNMRYGSDSSNQKNDILLKGIIKIHNQSCLNEECPLQKFENNPGNYNIQKQCLLNYMTRYFNLGIKNFPGCRTLILYFIQFNFSKRFNLNSVRTNLTVLQKKVNNYHDDFVIYCLAQDIKNMRNKISDSSESDNYEQEMDLIGQKYQRLKFLIENSTKLYGEFWGIFATNVTNNLNTLKLYNLGQKLNLYLNEINNLWTNELKGKKIEAENQSVVQLYSRFLKEILWNKRRSEEVTKKLNDEHQRHHESKKRVDDNIQRNNMDVDLENPDYIIYATSNEKGECTISQCSSSIITLLGYMKSEMIGKKIEYLMPKIFVDGHSEMLCDSIKKMHTKQHSQRNSYRENDKKMKFIVPKTKMGYLVPLNSKFTIYEDNDFSNSFIIKAQMEAKDTKSVYAYYILTKADFTVDTISSSALNLGLSMDMMNKHVIQMNLLVRNEKDERINLAEKISDYEEEPKEVTWVFPDLLYPTNEHQINRDKENEEILIKNSSKKKYGLQISIMRYGEDEIIGYVFKFNELKQKKKVNEDFKNEYIPHTNKEIMFDLLTLNYIRTILVEEKTGDQNLREKDEGGDIDSKMTEKNMTGEKRKKKKDDNLDDIQESSEEDDKRVEIILTKEKLMELQTKDYKDVQNFIFLLPFFGSDVSLEKHRPNRDRYPVGMAHEPLIKIEIGQFTKRIEERIKSNPDLMRKFKQNSKDSDGSSSNSPNGASLSGSSTPSGGDAKGGGDDYSHEFSSDTSTSLANIFNAKSVTCIKFTSAIIFLVICCIMTLEFIFTYLNLQKIKKRITYMNNAYELLNIICYSKYFITEAILSNEIENYTLLENYKLDLPDYIKEIKNELATYRQNFSDIYGEFSSSSDTFSSDYESFTTSTNVTITTLSNGQEMPEVQPFSTAMNRIPTTIFYVSTISDSSLAMNMTERNCFELMENFLNGYYMSWKEVTIILVRDAKRNSKNSVITTFLFAASFFINTIALIILWKILNNFIEDREKPINLFLTIKKKIFEELKNSSESFSNKLLNKFFGNEENEEESQKDYQTNIKITDINIIKFKAPNEYKSSVNKNSGHLLNYIKLVIFFVLFEGYMTFKYCFSTSNISNISKFIDVFNVTQFAHTDTVLSVDVVKSYLYNNSIPILNKNYSFPDSPFYQTFYNISEHFDNMFTWTSKTSSFLKGEYKKLFSQYLYEDFSDLLKINKSYNVKSYLNVSFSKGFKPISIDIFEILRFLSLQYLTYGDNQMIGTYSPIINDNKWVDLDYMLTEIIRPWYNNLINLLYNSVENFMGDSKVVQIAVFITVIAIVILAYCIVWKSYEEELTVLLKRSFDLINLIPEEIKYLIVCKLNE